MKVDAGIVKSVFLLMFCVGASLRADENLIQNGSFSGTEDEVFSVWQRPERLNSTGQRIQIISEKDKTFLRLWSDRANRITQIQQVIPVENLELPLKCSIRLRVRDLELGVESWAAPKCHFLPINVHGEIIKGSGWPSVHIRKNTDWVELSMVLHPPEGTTHIRVEPGLMKAAGTLDVAEVRVEPMKKADLPEGEKLWWGEELVERVSATREKISLNGWWLFQPAGEDPAPEPRDQWGFIRVPGSWRSSGWPVVPQTDLIKGVGRNWKGFDAKQCDAAWFTRRIDIPESWAGSRVLLDLERVSTDAVALLDGKQVGTATWPRGQIDITDAVKPGQTHRLSIHVRADPNAAERIEYMETAEKQVTKKKAQVFSKGLTADVWLRAVPAGPIVEAVRIDTSVRRNRLGLEIYLSEQVSEKIQLEALLLNSEGAVEEIFRKKVDGVVADGGAIQVDWTWKNPRLWSLDRPELYTLMLNVRGAEWNDEFSETFGFREFWIEGRDFYLNGENVRFRPINMQTPDVVEAVDAVLAETRAAGFTLGEIWPERMSERGHYYRYDLMYKRADRAGFPLIGALPAANDYLFTGLWKDPRAREEYRQKVENELRRIWNHPSILLWTTSPNFFGHNDDQDPRNIGRTGWADDTPNWTARAEQGRESLAMIRATDPTRPVFPHQGAYVGDLHSVNMYLNVIPIQEREEWLSEWSESGTMPFLPVELGTPLDITFKRGRSGHGDADRSEPLLAEYAAALLGARAYTLESEPYRQAIIDAHSGGQKYKFRGVNPSMHSDPAFQAMTSEWIDRTWKSWRTWGTAAGMIPWANGHGWGRRKDVPDVELPPFEPGRVGRYTATMSPFDFHRYSPEVFKAFPQGETLMRANGDTVAWIAGSQEAFTDKSRNYAAGETIEKQAVVIHDGPEPLRGDLEWTVLLGDEEIESGRIQVDVPSGADQREPIQIQLPKRLERDRISGAIQLQGELDGIEIREHFDFAVFAPSEPSLDQELLVLDPEGDTTALLYRLGLDWSPLTVDAEGDVLILGRRFWTNAHPLAEDIFRRVRDGATLLVMSQDPDWYRAAGFRVCPQVLRQVFPVPGEAVLMQGLLSGDLSDWRGHSSLLEPYPESYPMGPHGKPYYGWRWGSRGGVSSVALEKPHQSGWRPLLECGFDLAYSPLMESRLGQGRVVLCTLDLEDRGVEDPAADRLFGNLLNRLLGETLSETRTVFYSGGEDGEALLKDMSISVRTLSDDQMPITGSLLVLGGDFKHSDEEVQAWVDGGVQVLLLASEENQGRLGFMGELREVDQRIGILPQKVFAGLSESDVRSRTTYKQWRLVDAPKVEVSPDGLFGFRSWGSGAIIATSSNPKVIPAHSRTYLRLTRWRQTRALAQVLSNLGAGFETDQAERLFQSMEDLPVPLSGEWKVHPLQILPASPSPGQGHDDPGISPDAQTLAIRTKDPGAWVSMSVPGEWESLGGEWKDRDGEMLMTRTVEIPEAWKGRDLVLTLGSVDDADVTFWNGEEIGRGEGWNLERVYRIPGKQVLAGENILTVRVWDRFGGGGMPLREGRYDVGPERKLYPSFYHADYRDDFELGDDPYRYYRW